MPTEKSSNFLKEEFPRWLMRRLRTVEQRVASGENRMVGDCFFGLELGSAWIDRNGVVSNNAAEGPRYLSEGRKPRAFVTDIDNH